jgi:hypothetical protein
MAHFASHACGAHHTLDSPHQLVLTILGWLNDLEAGGIDSQSQMKD